VDATLQALEKIRPRFDQQFVFYEATPDNEAQAPNGRYRNRITSGTS
jgi:hypothetical protein